MPRPTLEATMLSERSPQHTTPDRPTGTGRRTGTGRPTTRGRRMETDPQGQADPRAQADPLGQADVRAQADPRLQAWGNGEQCPHGYRLPFWQPLLCHTLSSVFVSEAPERRHFTAQTCDSNPAPLLMGSRARQPDFRSPPPSVKWTHRKRAAPGPAPRGFVPCVRLPTTRVHVSPSRPASQRQGLVGLASLSPAPRLPKCQALDGAHQHPPGHLLKIQAPQQPGLTIGISATEVRAGDVHSGL